MPNFKSPILLQKLQRKARWAINDLGALLRPRVDSVATGPYRRILVYHGVDQKGEKKLNGRFISQSVLECHFSWLVGSLDFEEGLPFHHWEMQYGDLDTF